MLGRSFVLSFFILLAAGISCVWAQEYRSYDGSQNNLTHDEWGMAGTPLLRSFTAVYEDGISDPFSEDDGRPNVRDISNAVSAQTTNTVNEKGLSDFFWQWGQFVDHDIGLTLTNAGDPFNINVPSGDVYFDPGSSGSQVIAFNRSVYDPATGEGTGLPRQQINSISAYIDASVVYGWDEDRAGFLRTFSDGKLKTSAGGLLAFEEDGSGMFAAGDIRVNEQTGLTSLQTVFMREHNRLAELIGLEHAGDPQYDDEKIYQEARRIVGVEIQAITYNEFIPKLLGEGALPVYLGYQEDVNASLSNIFSSAAYRFGHSMLSPSLLRLDASGNPIPEGNLALRDAFFNPQLLIDEGGIDPVVRGLAAQTAQSLDPLVVDDVRNFLFGPPGAGGFDLASLNLQRGRDHGLLTYNEARVLYGLTPISGFDDPVFLTGFGEALDSIYDDINDVDLWIGGLAEVHVNGGMVGSLFSEILLDQFTRLRDGDRFWYESIFDVQELATLQNLKLRDILLWNTDIGYLQYDVFIAVHPVPEPASVLLFSSGLLGFFLRSRKNHLS